MSRWLYRAGARDVLVLEFAESVLCSLSRATPAADQELPELGRRHPATQVLDAYFAGDFSRYAQLLAQLSIQATGTPYQLRVWHALREIPLGSAYTYGTLAQRLGSAPRAVGQACRHNPVAILIPCHRVVGRHDWGGYGGQRSGPELEWKQFLLQHEGYRHGSD
ncbi:MAG: methylated-DNA--[protein]-cysteine S-methyltransferase [Candidatus Igneacidithiobacillus chanchocoensis]